MKKFLVTGSAGFIGFHFCRRLLQEGHAVVGLDNLSPYYSVDLKKERLKILQEFPEFSFECVNMDDNTEVSRIFSENAFTHAVNLAAQAGVRYSLEEPRAYIETNVNGYFNILDNCRLHELEHFIFASSSSVYGLNTAMPFSVHDNVDHPISLYAATKKSNELMAHSYSYLFGLPCTGLRFFTVYGPWGRPDMALFLFTKAILEGKPIKVFNHGKMHRDFTYIDDIIEGLYRVCLRPAPANPQWDPKNPDPSTSPGPYRLYNIGNNDWVDLLHFIEILENILGKKAEKIFLPLQPGDVPETYADIEDLQRDFGFSPKTQIEYGLEQFVKWYKDYFSVA